MAKQLKEGFLTGKKIKLRFGTVGRFYAVSREQIVKLQKEGKLSKGIENSLFEEVDKTNVDKSAEVKKTSSKDSSTK